MLVAQLAFSFTPSAIMGLTLLAIGAYAYATAGGHAVLAATIFGGLTSLTKVGLLVWHRSRLRQSLPQRDEARGWEMAHLVTTYAVAGSVGALAACLFAYADNALHMLATGLVFGYCSGAAARLFIRPWIAIGALTTAALPAAGSALVFGDTPDRILAMIFLVFLGGSVESVRHLYAVCAKEIETRLALGRMARTDALTGLANRFALQEVVQGLETRRTGFLAVHCFDLDDFKSINDRFGHAAGDDLLRQVATRLRTHLSDEDLAIRLGGDEFVVLQTQLERAEGADLFASQLRELLTRPYPLAGQPLDIGISHGYAVSPALEADLERMMQAADSASYRAKWRGGGLEQAV